MSDDINKNEKGETPNIPEQKTQDSSRYEKIVSAAEVPVRKDEPDPDTVEFDAVASSNTPSDEPKSEFGARDEVHLSAAEEGNDFEDLMDDEIHPDDFDDFVDMDFLQAQSSKTGRKSSVLKWGAVSLVILAAAAGGTLFFASGGQDFPPVQDVAVAMKDDRNAFTPYAKDSGAEAALKEENADGSGPAVYDVDAEVVGLIDTIGVPQPEATGNNITMMEVDPPTLFEDDFNNVDFADNSVSYDDAAGDQGSGDVAVTYNDGSTGTAYTVPDVSSPTALTNTVEDAPQAASPQVVTPQAQPAQNIAASSSANPNPSPSPAMARAAAPSGVNLYFDANNNKPPGETIMGDLGPRKVDPVTEPGSRYIIVSQIQKADSQDAMIASARRALELGHDRAAVELYERLYVKNPRDERILMGRAVALQRTGQHQAALRAYEGVLDVNDENADAMINMVGLLKDEYPAIAVRRMRDILGKYPNHPVVAAQLAVTLASEGQYDEALEYFGMAQSLEPQNSQHTFNMAIIYDRLKQTGPAIKMYQKTLDLEAMYGENPAVSRQVIYDRLATLRRR